MLLIEWPPMSHESVEAIAFRKLGFSVLLNQAIHLEEIGSLVLQHDLNSFDVIGISIVPLNTTKEIMPIEAQIDEIRKALRVAEKKKSSKIHLLGLHLSASSSLQDRLYTIFEGMFIGPSTSQQERDDIVEKILS